MTPYQNMALLRKKIWPETKVLFLSVCFNASKIHDGHELCLSKYESFYLWFLDQSVVVKRSFIMYITKTGWEYGLLLLSGNFSHFRIMVTWKFQFAIILIECEQYEQLFSAFPKSWPEKILWSGKWTKPPSMTLDQNRHFFFFSFFFFYFFLY